MEEINKPEANGIKLRPDKRTLQPWALVLSPAKVVVFPTSTIVPWAKGVSASVLNSSLNVICIYRYEKVSRKQKYLQ